jgi:gas vesicle protein
MLDNFDHESFAIAKRLISKQETTLLISPISGKRYIKSDGNQLFIIIESHQMTIVNHQYSYNIDIAGKSFEKISQVFDAEVEKRREDMETEIRSNVKHSLSNIYKSLLNEKI